MKKKFRGCAVLGIQAFVTGMLMVACGIAKAQNSVTLYGGIDDGIDYVNNSGGKSLVRMRDGTWDGMLGSRFGLKGNEDLGGGWHAIFRLEAGFDEPTGVSLQSGREFGRSAYVGLSDDQYGTFMLGRQYDLMTDYMQPVSSTGQFGGPFVHAGDIDNTANSFRVNNALKYVSPTYAGLTFSGMYAFTAGGTGTGTTGLWALAASWAHGGAKLATTYEHINNPAQQFSEGDFIANTTGTAIGASGPFSYVGQPRNQAIFGAGGSYRYGKVTGGFAFTNTRFDNANGTTSSVWFDNYDLWATYNPTPADTLGGAFIYSDGQVNYDGKKPKYYLAGLFASHTLSKRTTLYVMGAVQQASGDAPNADIFDYAIASASSTTRQTMVRIGMFHLF